MGRMAWLSWLAIPMTLPRFCSTPITWNGRPCSRTSEPTGFMPGKSVSARSTPMTITGRPSSVSVSLKKRPVATTTPLVSRYVGSVPRMLTEGGVSRNAVVSFLPHSWARGVAALTEGHDSTMARTSSPSRSLRLAYFAQLMRPKPVGHFVTSKVCAPRLPRFLFTCSRRPSMRAIIVMTVATPMTMPTSVRSERSGLPRKVPSASRKLSRKARIALFVAERFHRVQPGRTRGRPDAEQQAHQRRERHPAHHRARAHVRRQRRHQ
ncbi:hypothetical protein COEX109129_36530 [Corallococcus exiguus]